MAHAWKACWCNSLTSSNLVSSALAGTLIFSRASGFFVPSCFPLWFLSRSGSPYPAITYRQAAVALDVSYTTVWRTFRAMQEAKLIERTGSDRRGTWRIPTPPQLSHE